MKVLIIGASGLVGSHCLSELRRQGVNAIGTHLNYPTDITFFFDPSQSFIRIEPTGITDYVPDVIIHCAALTNVDYCESEPDESFRSTVRSTRNIVDYCAANKIKLVYISTDYVFDGYQGPYTENNTPNPINVYGNHKLMAEDLVRSLEEYLILRITNVYGEEARNKNFVSRLLEILNENVARSMNLPVDQFATPIYAGDIARIIGHLLADGKTGLYHLASTDYLNRYQFAKKIKAFFNNSLLLTINPVLTKAMAQNARRPLNGGLLNIKFSLEYPDFLFTSIDNYIQKVK